MPGKTLKKIIKNIVKGPNHQFRNSSYSQSGEDLIIDFIFKQRGITCPTYIDVGAHHPYHISNTALFYERGSRGINIEPDPLLYKSFLKCRKNDINLNIGICEEKGLRDFFIISSRSLNTFSKKDAYNYTKQGNFKIEKVCKVEVEILSNIIKEHAQNKFPDFLNIDAEGVDEMIIKQIDFQKNFPLVICVETISFSTSGNGIKNDKLIDFISSQGYLKYADTNINSIFVKEDFWKRKYL